MKDSAKMKLFQSPTFFCFSFCLEIESFSSTHLFVRFNEALCFYFSCCIVLLSFLKLDLNEMNRERFAQCFRECNLLRVF